MPFVFSYAICCTKVCLFASALTFDSELWKHLPAHQLNPTIWLPNGQGAKGPGNVRVLVYVSFPFVRSDYVISAGVGFRVVSGVVASP